MNRRDFLKGIIAIAATSPLASTLYPLFKKELFTPTKDTFISYFDGVNISLDPSCIQFDLNVPFDTLLYSKEGHIDFYVQDPDGYIQYIGSGEPGFKIPSIPVPNYPFRLLAKTKNNSYLKDKVPITLLPSGYEVHDDGTTLLRVFHQPIQIVSRTIKT